MTNLSEKGKNGSKAVDGGAGPLDTIPMPPINTIIFIKHRNQNHLLLLPLHQSLNLLDATCLLFLRER
ncbi:hypothetical protein V6N13_039373 [Hibiscus sabdariffa]|uniref:Uncharacterized protein n=1 Tax=Hibiscus sabdariffa TaxID=183260 RepID=A0ABR2SVS3_9ROSI